MLLGGELDSEPDDPLSAILSMLVRLAPSAASWVGALPAVISGLADGSEANALSWGSIEGAVVFVKSDFIPSGTAVDVLDELVGTGVELFFWPAFAAASAPACFMAIVMGFSSFREAEPGDLSGS